MMTMKMFGSLLIALQSPTLAYDQFFSAEDLPPDFDELSAISKYLQHEQVSSLWSLDHLCTSTSIVDDATTCVIKDKSLRYTRDLTYETHMSLVFENTILRCISMDYQPCDIHLKVNGEARVSLKNNASLQGRQVIIEAGHSSVEILDSSYISVSGQSYSTQGTNQGLQAKEGASFIGQGGSCMAQNSLKYLYGSFNMLPNEKFLSDPQSQIGSIGKEGDAETAGGGRIVLLADSVIMDGTNAKLEASARPTVDYTGKYGLKGGSAGYIYVKTYNQHMTNSLSRKLKIEAIGGYGFNNQFGGSGGVIVLDGGFSLFSNQYNVQGGVSDFTEAQEDGCGNGAAGTVYFRQSDKLIVDNQGIPTTQKTHLIASTSVHNETQQHVATSLTIQGRARATLTGVVASSLALHGLQMKGAVELDITKSLNLSGSDNLLEVYLSNLTSIDLDSKIVVRNYDHVWLKSNQSFTLGSVLFTKYLNIVADKLTVGGSLTTLAEESAQQHTHVIVDVKTLVLAYTARIKAGKLLIHAYYGIYSKPGAILESLKPNSCTETPSHSPMFNCVPYQALNFQLTPETFLQSLKHEDPSPEYLHKAAPTLLQNFTLYIFSFGDVQLNGMEIKGSKIGMCAQNIDIKASVVDSSGRGCLSSSGIGKGIESEMCAGSGGAHGGVGGSGVAYSLENEILCEKNVPKSYHSDSAKFEGSGGASGTLNTGLGGSGGGIIWLSTPGELVLNQTRLLSQGLSGRSTSATLKEGSGGGSGGSIQILTRSIAGDGLIDISGGDGSLGGGGGGSGGRLIVHFLENFIAQDQHLKSYNWYGTLVQAGGKAGESNLPTINKQLSGTSGQSGTSSQPACFGGYSGPFCEPCPVGTFKYNFGRSVCQPCTNKPVQSFYTTKAIKSMLCPYECDEGLDPAEFNSLCLTSLDLQMVQVGGAFASLEVTAGILTLVLTNWIMISAWNKLLRKKTEKRITLASLQVTAPAMRDQIRILSERDLKMTTFESQHHRYRMYLIGDNTTTFPWYMSIDFPEDALDSNGRTRLANFINQEQSYMVWTSVQQFIDTLVYIFAPCLVTLARRKCRKSHFKMLQKKLVTQFDQEHWESYWQNQNGLRVRLSADPDYQNCCIDFLDYSRNNEEGPSQLPLCLLLTGNGTVGSPYRIDQTDALAMSLIRVNPDLLAKKLPQFYQNLNTQLSTVSLLKFPTQTIHDLKQVVHWMDLANHSLFNPMKMKVTLWLFENSYLDRPRQIVEQRRRSFPLTSVYMDAFPQFYEQMIIFIRNKVYRNKSEVRFGLVYTTYRQEDEQRQGDMIQRALTQQEDQNEQSDRVQASISDILFNRTNCGFHEEEAQSGQDLTKKQAFEMSHQSSLSLEQAVNKRKPLKLKWASWIYSAWLTLFRHQSVPLKAKSLTQWSFMLFAALVGVDLLLTGIMTMHSFEPASNVKSFGVPYLFILPGLASLAPFWGTLSQMAGSPTLIRQYSDINATLVSVTFPIEFLVMFSLDTPSFYKGILVAQILTKLAVSVIGAIVCVQLENPLFVKNINTLHRWTKLYESVTADLDISEVTDVLTSALRQATLKSYLTRRSIGSSNPSTRSYHSSDDDDDDSDEEKFGIISIKALREQLNNGDGQQGEPC